jgi:5-methylcytosine-specific restriction endonuclease McrA
MKKHIKIFFEKSGYDANEFIPCASCGSVAVDIHHLEPKGMGGRKSVDTYDNLIQLCRSCHEKAHANILTKEQLKLLKQKFDNID